MFLRFGRRPFRGSRSVCQAHTLLSGWGVFGRRKVQGGRTTHAYLPSLPHRRGVRRTGREDRGWLMSRANFRRDRRTGSSPGRVLVLLVLLGQLSWCLASAAPTLAAPVAQTIDLRVLLIDDDSPWVDALQSQMTVEGVPFTAVPMTSADRPTITPEYLSSGTHAFYQSVIMPSYVGGGLSSTELSTVR